MAELNLPPKVPRRALLVWTWVFSTGPVTKDCPSNATPPTRTIGPSVMLKITSVSPGSWPFSNSQLAKGRPIS